MHSILNDFDKVGHVRDLLARFDRGFLKIRAYLMVNIRMVAFNEHSVAHSYQCLALFISLPKSVENRSHRRRISEAMDWYVLVF